MSEKDLIPFNKLTESEQKELARKGGIRSGEVRREKKLMSQIYAEFLEKEHGVIGKDGIKKNMSGHELLSSVMSKVLSRGDSASVSLIKEIREATEGNKMLLNIEEDKTLVVNIIPVGVKTEDEPTDTAETDTAISEQ